MVRVSLNRLSVTCTRPTSPSADHFALGLKHEDEPLTVNEASRAAPDEPVATVEAEQIQTSPGIDVASLPIYERDVSVDDVLYSQQSCGVAFGRGTTLRQLVEELHAGSRNPLASPVLKLELIQRGDRNSNLPSFSHRFDVGADSRLL